MARLFKIIKYITSGRMTAPNAFLYLFANLADTIVDMMPLAVLLGSLITISKMAKSLEVIALKTSGVSFSRIVRVPIILSLMLAIFTYWFNDNVVPMANKKARTLKNGQDEKVFKKKGNLFFKGKGPYIYYIQEIDGQKKSMKNVEVVKLSEDMSEILEVITAKSATYVKNSWEFYDVVINRVKNDEELELHTYRAPYLEEKVEDFLKDQIREKELHVREMRDAANFIASVGGNSNEILTALYKKIAYPFACFIVSFLGLSPWQQIRQRGICCEHYTQRGFRLLILCGSGKLRGYESGWDNTANNWSLDTKCNISGYRNYKYEKGRNIKNTF